MGFVLVAKEHSWSYGNVGFYSGKTYKHQDEVFAAIVSTKADAKIYSSRIRAEKAAESIGNKVSNYCFAVEEVSS